MPLTYPKTQAQADAWGKVKKTHAPRRDRSKTKAAHGTRTRYGAGCRCDRCRRANRNAWRVWQKKTRHGRKVDHGGAYAYGYFGCRCDVCKAAAASRRKAAAAS